MRGYLLETEVGDKIVSDYNVDFSDFRIILPVVTGSFIHYKAYLHFFKTVRC